jgi:hypothetical protein
LLLLCIWILHFAHIQIPSFITIVVVIVIVIGITIFVASGATLIILVSRRLQ